MKARLTAIAAASSVLLILGLGLPAPAFAHGRGSVTVTSVNAPTETPAAGSTGTMSVGLSAAAPSGGSVVTLSSSNSSAFSVPASVTVAAGQTTGDFSYTAGAVSTATAVTVTATLGSSSASVNLTVTPVSLFSLEIGPADDELGGTTVTLEPDLSGPAPAGGAEISLTSSDPSLAPVPATVEIPAGDYLIAVSVPTAAVSAVTDVTFTATYDGTTVSSVLELDPVDAPVSVTFSPATTSGTSGSTGTVTLADPAPGVDELTVGLTSSDPSAASVGEAFVEPGATTGTFTVTTAAVTADTTVTITATTDGGSVSGTLALTPPPPAVPALQAISLSATSVAGGTSVTGTATLNVAAPSGGAAVQLVSSNTAAASVPSSLTVPAGATSATFTVTTDTVKSTTTVGIGGIYGPGYETDGASDSAAPGEAAVLLGVTGKKGSVLSPPPSGIDIEPFSFPPAPEGTQRFSAVHPLEISLAGTLNEFEISVESGSLPPGFTISSGFASNVLVSGSPTTQGLFASVLEFTISGGPTFAWPYVWQITPPLEVAQVNLPEGQVGAAYDGGLTGSGGTPPYTWSIVPPDALPPGLSLNTSTGAITGTPTTSGTYSFTVGLIDSNEFGATSSPSETITISPG